MKLGIDFGTTHTIVSFVDQGNHPVINFSSPEGDWFDYFPSLIAVSHGQVRFGFDAYQVINDPAWTLIRSIKTLLKNIYQEDEIEVDGTRYKVIKLLIDYFAALKTALEQTSSLEPEPGPMQVSIAVPANTNNTQRFITQEAITGGGFDLLNVFNEPSAATMEYTSNFFKQVSRSSKKYLLVYDLGGGTFDASIAELHDHYHQIVATEGIENLGGDQFDEVLAQMVLDSLQIKEPLNYREQSELLELCREKKESITPHTKTLLIEWAMAEEPVEVVRIDVKDYFSLMEPLVDQTIAVLNRLIEKVSNEEGLDEFTALYLVGGMSNFPLVARKIKQAYGQHKVKKSHHCQSSVAIGLATLEEPNGDEPVLKEALTRYFGLWREEKCGESFVFDPIFGKNTQLPAKNEPPIVLRRRYQPSHNVGVFRFQECSLLDQGQPSGLIAVWSQINFPFEKSLQEKDLTTIEVLRYPQALDYEVEEIYSLNHQGEISFKVMNHQNGYTQTFQLSKMSGIK